MSMEVALVGISKVIDAHPGWTTDIMVSEEGHNEFREFETLVAIYTKSLGP